jgi:hypothetical protein
MMPGSNSPTSNSSQGLCARCQKLDIDSIFDEDPNKIPEDGKAIVSLGRRPRNLGRVQCPLCHLFYSVSTQYKRKYWQHVRLFNRVKQSNQNIASKPSIAELFLSVLRENSRLEYDDAIQNEYGQTGILVYHKQLPEKQSVVKTVDATAVEYRLIKAWLAQCENSHALCRQIRHSGLPYVYLIDCTHETVVQAQTSEKYLTLSYVWGKERRKAERWQDGSRSEESSTSTFARAPLTVRDAMVVTKSLGQRYLWVDKYCIKQEDGPEKELMIRSMDQIYENAEATIVALYGDNDDSGLPGVSMVSRSAQSFVSTAGGRLVSSLPPISTIIADSIWATRGWTYQEARLSRRCLFFTEHQVYLVCRETTRSESVPSTSESSWISSILNSTRLDASLFGYETSISEGLFRDRLMFSQRTLTYQRDVLDAFRGILTRSPFVTFWGVPIIPPGSKLDPCIGFALGLLWVRRPSWSLPRHVPFTKATPYIRRPGFPTWSWTSLIGEIYNEGFGDHSILGSYLHASTDISATNEAGVEFWLRQDGDQAPLHKILEQHSTNVLPEYSTTILVEGDVVRVKLSDNAESFHFYGQDDGPVALGSSAHLDLAVPAPDMGEGGRDAAYDALILVEWHDSQRKGKRRLVMMLLHWIGPDVAERKGLLSEYRREWTAESLKKIPRTRRRFTLQ